MVTQYCKKGDIIGIHGMIQSRTYEKDDKKVYTTEIIVDKLNFISTGVTKKEETKIEEKSEEVKSQNDAFEDFSKEADLSELDNYQLPF